MVRRSRFACLLPVFVFIILRALSHAHPAPPPWALGVFDGGGLDDLLQGIRIPYARSSDALHESQKRFVGATGRVVPLEPLVHKEGLLATVRSRGPPSD